MSIRTEKQITETEVENRISNLNPGQTTSFSSSEVGYKFLGHSVIVAKNERGGQYTMSQAGDWLGDDNTVKDVVNFIINKA